MPSEKLDDGDDFSRRRFLETSGVAGVVAFGGSVPSIADTGGGAAGVSRQGKSGFRASLSIQNPNINFNEFNFTNYSWDLTEMLHDPLVKWHPEREEYVPMILEDWNLGEETMEMTISDEYVWHNGDQLTAEDVANSLQLEIWFGFSVSEYATAARATDDTTVELDLADQFNEHVLEHELFGGTWVNKPPHVYEEWIERFEDADGEEEMGAVQEELAQWELSEPFGNGPFEVGSMNEQRMELVPHDGHPASDAINFDSYTLEYITTNQNVWQAIRSGNVDGVPSTFAPQEVADSFPDHVIQTLHPSYTGFGLHFNHDNPHFSKRPVRQAIAHVVDREQVARNSGANTKTPVEVVNGLPPSTQDEWFGDSSMFAAYEPDPGRAAQLLEEAGYQRQGNVWQGSDGPIEATLITRADFSDWVTAAQTVASQLTNFGMDVQLQTMEGPTFDETFERGDFELAGGGWGSGPYPLFSFENFYDEEARSAIHYPEEVTVPEVGSDSGELAVNFPETLSTLTQSAENHEETFRQLAWAFNQDLPVLPIQEKMLECVGMTPAHDYAARYPHQLSGGEKQRAALVRALLMNPDLVLADEAVSALDVSLRVEMMDLMLDLQDDFGTSYVFVSHDLSNARYFAEHAGGRIGVMYLGELVELGPAEDIVQNPRHPYTQVLTWATPDIDPAKATVGEPPVRRIDVPDPRDPPSGCRFHTRCPEARAVCPREHPELMDAGPDHGAACFRVEEDHPYWESPPLEDVDESSGGAGEAGGRHRRTTLTS